MSNGRRIPLERSQQELAVRLRPSADRAACMHRLSEAGMMAMRDVDGCPHWDIKLVQVPAASRATRVAMMADPDVVEVREVYRTGNGSQPLISSGTINIRLVPELDEAARDAMFADYLVQLVEPIEGLPNTYIIEPVVEDVDEVLLAEVLADDWRVIWSQPNLIRPATRAQIATQDTYYPQQWHLNNTGQVLGTKNGVDINAKEAWAISEGLNIRIGVFDDAVDVEHPDLITGYLGVGHDASVGTNAPGANDPRPKQFGDSHGTQVIGLAVAQANTEGVRGVAYLGRFTASRGLSSPLSDAQVASVWTFALQQQVDVHINSWGRPGPIAAVIRDKIEQAFKDGRDFGGTIGKKGMVVVFASGNEDRENEVDIDLATLPEVISVGASNSFDERASYSNWGPNTDVLAPSGDDFLAGLVTTDVRDNAGFPDMGSNVGGVSVVEGFFLPDIDPQGNYTRFFSGTSGACPIAAGVAALILSRNPLLTATDVKLILQHTAVRIDPAVAGYNGVTGRSLKYGYGRIDALAAVQAAEFSTTNGNRTWPARVQNARIQSNNLVFQQSFGMNEFLVVELASNDVGFIPEDGVCYSSAQLGCSSAVIAPLPPGATLLDAGCGVDKGESCQLGSTHNVSFVPPASGVKYFGIYGRSTIGRYSFGVKIDSNGVVTDGGSVITDPGTPPPIFQKPQVTITAMPLSGNSPLTVKFDGNAVSSLPIDDSKTVWDFDVTDSSTINSNQRNTSYTYNVPAGQKKTFIARLTMYDAQDNSGSASVAIQVDGGGTVTDGTGTATLKIVVGLPGTPGSDVSGGTAPFTAQLSIDGKITGGVIQNVLWDLGDGGTAGSLAVTHTYQNTTTTAKTFPIVAQVTIATSASTTFTQTVSRTITVQPQPPTSGGSGGQLPGTGASGPGGSASLCGAVQMIPIFLGWMGLKRSLRRRP